MFNIEPSEIKFKHQVLLGSGSDLSSQISFPSPRDPTRFTGVFPSRSNPLANMRYEVVKKKCRILTPKRKEKGEDDGELHKYQAHSSEYGSTFLLHIISNCQQ